MTSNTPSTTSEPEPCVVELAAGVPTVSGIEPYSAVFTWEALERVPTGLTPVYAIELQQLESVDSTPSSNWVSVYKGDALSCKVDELKSGRRYAVRLCVSAESSDSDSPDGGLEVRAANSDNVFFHTPATVPSAIQPPALAQRARNALKLKWNTPEDPGGVFELTYVLQVSPAPIGLEEQRAFMGFVEVYRGPERSFKVMKLQPGVRYTSRVQAINALGEGPFSLCSAYTTQATVPTPPEPPVVQTASSTTLTLQWSPPPDNGSPIMCYCLERDDGAAGDFNHVYAGPNTLHVVKGLRPGTQYRFRLRADNDEGKSMWSGTTTLSTGAAPPDSPVSLQVVTASRTSATLAWRAPDDDGGSKLVAFEVELQAKSRAATACMGADWLKIFEGEAHACTINSLRPGCAYRVRVRARNGAGWGQWALPVDLATAADAPEAPLALQPASCSATTIVITWGPPRHDGGAKVHTYRMEMASADCLCGRCPHAMGPQPPHGPSPYPGAPAPPPQAGMQGYPGAPPPPPPLAHAAAGGVHRPTLCPAHTPLAVYAGETVGAELRHLQPGCRYIFRVQAVNAQGASAWTDWAAGATTPDAPVTPGPPAVAGVAATALMLSWQVPPGQGAPVTHFTVEAAPLPVVPGAHLGAPGPAGIIADPRVTASLGFRLAYRGAAPACEVRGLEPYCAYAFRLCAHNDVGPSPWSVCAAAITAHAPPTCPQSFSAQAASSVKIVLCWAPPERDFGAPVLSYTVEAAPVVRPGRDGPKPGGVAWAHAYTGPACACAAEGLAPGRSYQFRVRAANGCGCGPFTQPLTATTLPAPPSVPGRPVVSGRTSSGFRARWDEPEHTYGALVTSYVLEISVAGGVGEASGSVPGVWAVAYNGPEAAAKLSGLLPATRYLLRAAAVNAAGQGPFGEAEAVATTLLPPQPPCELAVAEVAEQQQQQQQPSGSAAGSASWADLAAAETAAVSVAWREPVAAAAHAGVQGYEVVAAPRPGSDVGGAPGGGVVRATVGRRCEARLEGLALGCQYGVRVRAVGADAAGHSGWTEEVAFTTPAAQPDAEASSPGAGAGGGATQRAAAAAGAKGAAKKQAKKQAAAAAATAASAAASCGSSDEAAATVSAAANGHAGARARAKPSAAASRVAAAVTTVAAKTRRKTTLMERLVDETPPSVGRTVEVVARCVFGPAWRRDHGRLMRTARSLFLWTLMLSALALMVYMHYAQARAARLGA